MDGDVDLTDNTNLALLVTGGLFGGWMCGALGLGGGIIYNQLLMAMKAPPAVATATGMWLISFASLATLIQYAISGILDFTYALWIGSFCLVATAIGMVSLNWYMKKFNRQSPIVILLTFILWLSLAALIYSMITQLKGKQDIWKLNSIC